jgi:hypothetical protein
MQKLTDEEIAELIRLVRVAIEDSRYPLSAKTELHKQILAKLEGREPAPKKPRPGSPARSGKRPAQD